MCIRDRCHLSHSSCNLIAASIIHGDLEVQLIIILGKLLQFTDAFLNIRCKSRDIADNFDFHLIIPGYLDTFLKITTKQLHKPVHFFSGAFPVLRGKSIYCQIFHAQIFNIIADLLQIGAALNMSIACLLYTSRCV